MRFFKSILKRLGLTRTKAEKAGYAESSPLDESPFPELMQPEGRVPMADAKPQSSTFADADSFLFSQARMPRSTVGLYYPEGGVFLIRHPDEQRTGLILQFGGGSPGLVPVTGDWNGDGIHGIGVYDPERGLFLLRENAKNGEPDHRISFGPAGQGWLPLAGDWDGDGIYSVGLYNPADGGFFLSNHLNGGEAEYAFRFGPADAGWLPVVGDWNGDGAHSIGLYNPGDGQFYLRNRLAGGDADRVFQFGPGPGNPDMWPFACDWEGTGLSTVGLYEKETGVFHLCPSSIGGSSRTFAFGARGASAIPFSISWI